MTRSVLFGLPLLCLCWSVQAWQIVRVVGVAETANQLGSILDEMVSQQSNGIIVLRMRPLDKTNVTGYTCLSSSRRIDDQYSPWDTTRPRAVRRMLESMANVVQHHRARIWIDHIVISWTSESEQDSWQLPTRFNDRCIDSEAAQTSLRRSQQEVDTWYRSSLLDIG